MVGRRRRLTITLVLMHITDTIYACQDIRDDVKMNVRSTAILWGTWIRPLLVACGVIFVSMLAVAGVLNNQGTPYFVVSVGGTVLHLIWQSLTVDLDVPKSCWSTSPFFRTIPGLTETHSKF